MIGPKRTKLSPVERKLNQRAMEQELVRILNENFKEDCDMGKHKFRLGDRVVYRITDGGPGNTELEGWHGTVIYVEQLAPMTIVHGSNVLDLMWKKVDIPEKAEAVWITDEEGIVTCSHCGEEHTWDDFRPPFCDMCGKRMRDGREDVRNEQS